MDAEQLKNLADYQFDRSVQLQTQKEIFQSKLLIAHNGGLFSAGPQLIGFLNSFKSNTQLVVEDTYGNPVQVETGILLKKAIAAYTQASMDWHDQVESINSVRKALDV